MEWNHNRKIDDPEFQRGLEILRRYDYKPIGVTQMMLEDTYIFETAEEAKNAYETFEKNPINPQDIIIAWWYGRDDFLKECERYENDECKGHKVLVHWL